jgi:hypothetical protein
LEYGAIFSSRAAAFRRRKTIHTIPAVTRITTAAAVTARAAMVAVDSFRGGEELDEDDELGTGAKVEAPELAVSVAAADVVVAAARPLPPTPTACFASVVPQIYFCWHVSAVLPLLTHA